MACRPGVVFLELQCRGLPVDPHAVEGFPAAKQRKILHRLREGPPHSWFREGAEIDRYIDRSRFDILSDMAQNGFDIGREAKLWRTFTPAGRSGT